MILLKGRRANIADCEALEVEKSGPKCDESARASNKNDIPRSSDKDSPSYRETIRTNNTIIDVARVTPRFVAVPLKVVGVVGWAGTENVILLEAVGEERNPPWDVVAAPVPTFAGLPVADSVAVWVGVTTVVELEGLSLVKPGVEISTGNTVVESRIVDP